MTIDGIFDNVTPTWRLKSMTFQNQQYTKNIIVGNKNSKVELKCQNFQMRLMAVE